jgi:hypothetical protein
VREGFHGVTNSDVLRNSCSDVQYVQCLLNVAVNLYYCRLTTHFSHHTAGILTKKHISSDLSIILQ